MKKIASLCVLCVLLLGCQTIRQKILEEEETLLEAEIVGLWYHKQWKPLYAKMAHEKSPLVQLRKSLRTVEQVADAFPDASEDTSPSTDPSLLWDLPRTSPMPSPRLLFLKPGDDGERAALEIYLPRQTSSRWSLILSPTVELNTKNPDQTLFDYVLQTLLLNIENIQGKAGVALEW